MKKVLGCLGVVLVASVILGAIGLVIGLKDGGLNIDSQASADGSSDAGGETSQQAPVSESKPAASKGEIKAIETVSADQSLWPKQVILEEPVEMTIVSGGNQVGSMQVPAGQAVDVVSISGGKIEVGRGDARATVEAAATDLVAQSKAAQEQRAEAGAAKQKQIDKEFMQGCLDAGWVTYIEQADYARDQFHVRLPAQKYTTKDNVKSIAEYIARGYVMQSKNKGGNATGATVHVWQGDKVLVRGSYRE